MFSGQLFLYSVIRPSKIPSLPFFLECSEFTLMKLTHSNQILPKFKKTVSKTVFALRNDEETLPLLQIHIQ
jgi:hypothetical protein